MKRKYNTLEKTEILVLETREDQRGRYRYVEAAVWADAQSKANDTRNMPGRVPLTTRTRRHIYADGVNSFRVSYVDSPGRDVEAEIAECIERWKQRAIAKDYLATRPDRRGTTLNLQVASGANDARRRKDGVVSDNNGVQILYTASLSDSSRYRGATRFSNVTIPSGSTIDGVTFNFNLGLASTAAFDANFHCELHADAADYSTHSNLWTRTLTTNYSYVTTNFSGYGWHSFALSPAIIQEVVDLGGWTSGNALSVVGEGTTANDDDSRIDSYDFHSTRAAKLDIDYTEGSGGSLIMPEQLGLDCLGGLP